MDNPEITRMLLSLIDICKFPCSDQGYVNSIVKYYLVFTVTVVKYRFISALNNHGNERMFQTFEE
jgi:hypothetical protein